MVKIILSNSLIVNANMHVTSSTNFSSSGLYFRFWKWNLSLQRNYVIPDDVLEVFEPCTHNVTGKCFEGDVLPEGVDTQIIGISEL